MRASDVESESASQRWELKRTDCRTRRKSLNGKANNLILLQQDALFYLLSHKFFHQNLTLAFANVANA